MICNNKCPLFNSKKVFGSGIKENRLMLIGEAPGTEEERLGKPFVGRSGKLLNKMFKYSKLSRELFYITNIVKCRPPNGFNPIRNRAPTNTEINYCKNHLFDEIFLIHPILIILVGSTALSFFSKRKFDLCINKINYIKIKDAKYPFFTIYHPSYVIRGGISEETYLASFNLMKQIILELYNKIKKRVDSIIDVLS